MLGCEWARPYLTVLANNGPDWTKLDLSGPQWTTLDHFEPILWTSLRNNPVRSSLYGCLKQTDFNYDFTCFLYTSTTKGQGFIFCGVAHFIMAI